MAPCRIATWITHANKYTITIVRPTIRTISSVPILTVDILFLGVNESVFVFMQKRSHTAMPCRHPQQEIINLDENEKPRHEGFFNVK